MSHFDDLEHAALRHGAIAVVEPIDDDKPTVLVAPLGSALPDDGIFEYVTFNSFSELLNVKHGAVVLFRDDQAGFLRILSEHHILFGLDVKPVYGVPNSAYEPWFDDATFGLPKLSYHPLVSEVRIARDVQSVQEANRPVSVVQKEEKQVQRADGSVRYDDRIGVANEDMDDGIETT